MTTLDRVRAIIRSEVARAHPRAESRRALELIVESSVRFEAVDGELRISVVDEDGHRRTAVKDGREVDFTIPDLVAELRGRHPSLFGTETRSGAAHDRPAAAAGAPSLAPIAAEPAAVPSVAPIAAEPDAAEPDAAEPAAAEPGAVPSARRSPAPAASPPVRDILGVSSVAPEAAPGPSLARASEALPEPAPAAESPSPDPLPADAPSPVPTDRDPIVAGWVPWTARLGAVLRRRLGGLDAAWRRLGGGGLPRLPRLSVLPLPQPRLGLRSVLSLAAVAVLVPLVAILAMSLISDSRATRPPDAPTTVAARSAAEPDATGTVPGQDPPPPGPAAGPLRGVPEVLDTATLSVQGKVVRLFGVEWARGAGDPDDLAGYLRGREVVCRPEGATERYRCEVQGQDLSRVVLFNGGGRATPDATPDLKAAEEHARSQQIGVWGPESLKARP